MRPWNLTCLYSLLCVSLVAAEEVVLTEKYSEQVKCEGMYSRKAWGGGTEPHILVKYLAYESSGEDDPHPDPVVASIIFEWKDHDLIGIPLPQDDGQRAIICNQDAIDADLCNQDFYGNYLLANSSANEYARNPISSAAVHLASDHRPAVNYPIKKTGYYCVNTYPMDPSIPYQAIVEFRNAYGELPGAQIPKLPFYGAITIVYAVIGLFWAFLYFQNRTDILPVQNYVTATIIFLIAEMLMTWGYYDYMNRNGSNAGAKALMLIVSILNAARNSLSFFLLLIVCMGYGVVKPTLGKTMIWVRWLASTHFVFGVIYAIGSLTIKPEDAGPLVLIVVLPLAASGTAFYVWTLNSLGITLKDLMERKQRIKALMYRKLWWCILSSVLIIFAFFFLNIVLFSGRESVDFLPNNWQTRWFVLDGWLNLVYMADVAFIAYLWRPTANNRRFAMSDELAQDDEGFEIASIRDSLDFDAEDEGHENGFSNGLSTKPSNNSIRGDSPLPAPRAQRPSSRTAEHLDGETIFAVGEEDGDRFSDEGDDSERKGLTRKDS